MTLQMCHRIEPAEAVDYLREVSPGPRLSGSFGLVAAIGLGAMRPLAASSGFVRGMSGALGRLVGPPVSGPPPPMVPLVLPSSGAPAVSRDPSAGSLFSGRFSGMSAM